MEVRESGYKLVIDTHSMLTSCEVLVFTEGLLLAVNIGVASDTSVPISKYVMVENCSWKWQDSSRLNNYFCVDQRSNIGNHTVDG
jgi:hypothetical protein